MPSLLFFTVGLILMYKQNGKLYYPLFAVAVLCGETIFFSPLSIFLPPQAGRPGGRSCFTFLHSCPLNHHCIRAVSGMYRQTLDDRQAVCVPPPDAAGVAPGCQVPADVGKRMGIYLDFGPVWIPVDNGFVKRSLRGAIPFMLRMSCAAVVLEMRVYGELTPVLLSAAVLGLKGRAGRRLLQFLDKRRIDGVPVLFDHLHIRPCLCVFAFARVYAGAPEVGGKKSGVE